MAETRHNNSRRNFCALAGGAAVSLALNTACGRRDLQDASTAGRLTARPHDSRKSYVSGRTNLGLDNARDAILQTPKNEPSSNFPLLVFLHGAGQSAEQILDDLGTAPEAAGVAVLAPNSRGQTWDAIAGGGFFGPDVKFLDEALKLVFEMLAIDARHVVLGGFSDGASYAISLGMINGDLFPGVMAFSPGFIIDSTWVGKPRFFLAHGKQDQILPFKNYRQQVYGKLIGRAYGVTGKEFDGGHEMPAAAVREGFQWMASL